MNLEQTKYGSTINAFIRILACITYSLKKCKYKVSIEDTGKVSKSAQICKNNGVKI